MQLESVKVAGLFGVYTHELRFEPVDATNPNSAVSLIYGPNGVGKTTLLRMLDSLMTARRPRGSGSFDIFRTIPFQKFTVKLSGLDPVTLIRHDDSIPATIEVCYQELTSVANLDLDNRSISTEETDKMRDLMGRFRDDSEELSFELIETARTVDDIGVSDRHLSVAQARLFTSMAADRVSQRESLSNKMARFISDAQVNYREFFNQTSPEMFPKIIERLANPPRLVPDVELLLARLSSIRARDARTERLGLERDRWDFDQLAVALRGLSTLESEVASYGLAIAGQYIEMLESQVEQRQLIADRLFTFERLINDCYVGKRVAVDPRVGLRIVASNDLDQRLDETDLSSGEQHLLYLLVSAVIARRRGTVIAIDEPEMSMHIEWQRKLVQALLECAANAEPQFIFATHSPDLTASYPESLIELRAS